MYLDKNGLNVIIKVSRNAKGIEGTSSYSYIIDPAVAMSGCFAARDRIKSEYGIVKDVRENSRGFYVVVDFDEEDVH